MATFNTSSLLITLQMLDTAGNNLYIGNDNNITLWGSQLELGEYAQDLINELDNYRYIRTRGWSSSLIKFGIGADFNTDAIALPDPTKFFISKRVQRAGDPSFIQININNLTKVNAAQVAEEFVNYKANTPIGKRWFQLAPYYSSFVHRNDLPTDADLVRIGSPFGSKVSGDVYESTAFYFLPATLKSTASPNTTQRTNVILKEFSETRMIPQNPKYDAAAVAGIFVANKTAKSIDLTRYTPLSGGTTYYKQYDWFSEAPLASRARFAIGNAGTGPVMLDTFLFGDVFTYEDFKVLSSVAIVVGTNQYTANTSYLVGYNQNLMENSQNLMMWSRFSGTAASSDVVIAPDGTMTADRAFIYVSDSVIQGQFRVPTTYPISTGSVLTVSLYIKPNYNLAGEKGTLQFSKLGGKSFGVYTTFDSTGNLINFYGGGSDITSVTLRTQDAANGFKRVSWTFIAPSNIINSHICSISYFKTSYAGAPFSSTSSCDIWGAQVEVASAPGTYIATTGSGIVASPYNYTVVNGTKYSGDSQEWLDINLRKSAKQSVFTDLYVKNRQSSPLDADQIVEMFYNSSNNVSSVIRNNPYKKAWYQLAPYYSSYGHIKSSPMDTDRVLLSYKEIVQLLPNKGINSDSITIGSAYPYRQQYSQNSSETTIFNTIVTAKRAALTSSYAVYTEKTNWISHSENINVASWVRTNVSVFNDPTIKMSGKLPYRNTKLDALQISDNFLLQGGANSYTYWDNYYGKNWFTLTAPLTNRQSFSSTVLHVVNDSDTYGPHILETNAYLPALSVPEEYFTFSLFAQKRNNGRYFRMEVGRIRATFDLDTGTAVTSTGTVYNSIKLHDTANGIYLCQIIGPIQTFTNILNRLTTDPDYQTITDSGIKFLFRDKRTFEDSIAPTESLASDRGTDYMTAGGVFDYMDLNGDYDYLTGESFSEFPAYTALDSGPAITLSLEDIFGSESLDSEPSPSTVD